jgi:hypothetical protein
MIAQESGVWQRAWGRPHLDVLDEHVERAGAVWKEHPLDDDDDREGQRPPPGAAGHCIDAHLLWESRVLNRV